MASPKVHGVYGVTVYCILGVIGWFFYSISMGKIIIDGLFFIIFTLGIDADHLFHWSHIKRARVYKKENHVSFVEAWLPTFLEDGKSANLFHTWIALVGVILISYLFHNIMPLAGYLVHILIDSFDAGYVEKKNYWEVPGCIGQLVPVKWRYQD